MDMTPAEKKTARRKPGWPQRVRLLLIIVFCCQLAFSLSLIPRKGFKKRLEKANLWAEIGGLRYFLDRLPNLKLYNSEKTFSAIRWLQENSPPQGIIIYSGGSEELLMVLTAALAPRLLVPMRPDEDPEKDYAPRPITRGTLPGQGKGVIWLVDDINGLHLEVH